MPPPGSYIDITPIPFSRVITQAEFNGGTFGGTANTIWLRFVTATRVMFGAFTTSGGTFSPDTTLYESDGSTVLYSQTFPVDVFAWRYPLDPGTYYIKITRKGGGASDFDFTVTADTLPINGLTVPPDAIIINDDQDDFPAIVMTVDGTLIGYVDSIPAGEIGAILPSGVQLWYDPFGMKGAAGSFALVDANLGYVLSTSAFKAGGRQPIIAASDTSFYVVDRDDGSIYEITEAGVENGVIATLPTVASNTGQYASSAGASADGSVLYWANGFRPRNVGNPAEIRAHNLVTDTDLGVIYTPGSTQIHQLSVTPNGHPGDLLVLPDGTLVTWRYNFNDDAYILLHLSEAGAELQTYTYTVGVDPYPMLNHLAKVSSVDSTQVYIWLQDADLFGGLIGLLTLATGVILPQSTDQYFTASENLNEGSPSPVVGISESCTLLAFLAGGGGDEERLGPIAWLEWSRVNP